MANDNRYWQALKQHYGESLSVVFKQFRLGASIFFTGMVAVYAGHKLPSSWPQEITLALGLICVAVGFIIAMMAHIRMLIIRVINFIKDKPY